MSSSPKPEPRQTASEEPTRASGSITFASEQNEEGIRCINVTLAFQLKGINPEMIMAVDHTDRLGSDRYNQRLPKERVEAVKAYSVDKGIEPNRMQTQGKGETQPVTKAGECEGAESPKVIVCLRPDRRVEMEVVGTTQ